MSLLKGRRKTDGGAAGTTAATGTPAPSAKRTIDPAAYGFVPAAQVRADRAGPSPHFDAADRLITATDWRGMSTLLAELPATSEWRFQVIARLAAAAAKEDDWLREWLAAQPRSVDALSVQAESLVALAWEIRTTQRAENVTREQWDTFFRVLRDVPDVCGQAAEIDAADPAPWIALQSGALGLQWSNDKYRELWAEVSARAPHSLIATQRAWRYWLPRWYGSRELMEEFVEGAIEAAPPGSNLTLVRLQMFYDELRPDGVEERRVFDHSERVNDALSAGIADTVASDPDHSGLPHLRHWLSYQLWLAGRYREAIQQFQAIGGYCGSAPYTRFKNPAAKFSETRANVVVGWQDAGRPGGELTAQRPGGAG